MKFAIKQNILMEYLNYVIKGTSNKDLIPILKCIKFELTEEGLYLYSTNNDISIKTFIDKKDIESIDEVGTFLVSGRFIYDSVKKISDDKDDILNIEYIADSKIKLYNSNTSYDLSSNIVSEFPDLELDNSENPIRLPKKLFKTIINQTMFATSQDESRPVLTGLNVKIENDTLECTATDSFRLAQKKIKLDTPVEEEKTIIIPANNLNELIKMLNDDDSNIELHIFENKIIFKLENLTMMSTLINGTYPDVSKLIPTKSTLTLKVSTSEFYKSMDKASLFTNEREKNAIRLETKGNNIKISSNIPEQGYVEANITCTKDNDNDIKISFSSKYMMDAVKSLESAELLLMFDGDAKPIIVKSTEDDNLKQLILPIRTY